jgi:hypothetical protein
MPLNLASPGIVVREVDLTLGSVRPSSARVGGIVSPFARGPIDSPTLVENENSLLNNFGEPYPIDKHYEGWLTASSYLSYGGTLQVIRADDLNLKNAFVGTASSTKIKSVDHYEELGYDENTIQGVVFAAKNPGSWANGIKVAIIDSKADQILSGVSTDALLNIVFIDVASPSDGDVGITTTSITGITTNLIEVGQTLKLETGIIGSGTTVTAIGVGTVFISPATLNTTSLTNQELSFGSYGPGTLTPSTIFVGVATVSNGDIGINTTTVTGITTNGVGNVIEVGQTLKLETGIIGSGTTVTSIGVGTVFLSSPTLNSNSLTNVELSFGSYQTILVETPIQVGYGVTQSLSGKVDSTSGEALSLDGYYLKGIVTQIDQSKVYVKILSRVSAAGTETNVEYQQDGVYCFPETGSINIMRSGDGSFLGYSSYTSEVDWFSQQQITLTNTSIPWNNLAPKPRTSAYAAERGCRFDEIHVVIFDDLGTITGNAGTILETHTSLSKATDAKFSAGSTSYWRKYLASASSFVFGGSSPVGITTIGFDAGQFDLTTDNGWDQPSENVIFGAAGSNTYTLNGGLNYDGGTSITNEGALTSTLAELNDGYDLFSNTEDIDVDFLLMGSAGYDKETAQSLANKLIAVAELRKDAIAFISPYRGAALTDTSVDTAVTVNAAETITINVLSFYASIASSSYAVFDSGYKYMYDRFSDVFRYVPLNGDIAGLCARTDINDFPWYSPAGTARGAILNAVKLAYTPSKSQRDRLYTNRINPIIFSPGAGIILFGDKTGLARASAFDRINVRRLFLYLEDAISRASKDFLFEFNDEITRTNFVNTIEPFLRDVQGKRGIFDYIVICDESNNTASVIDANEFRADIYIKPARSINFIGLTFIATKTGVDFEEVIGNF